MLTLGEKVKLFFKKTYTVDDIVAISDSKLKEYRTRTRILIIDDEDVPFFDSLQRRGYNVTYKEDIYHIDDVSSYDVIITDVVGVGIKIDNVLEGGGIVKEVKKIYPEKYVIVYSASQFDVEKNSFFQLADSMMKKDSDIDEWSENIDDAIVFYYDPKSCWERVREKLLKSGVSTYKIMVIESDFVKSVINNTEFKVSSYSLDDNCLKILQPLVNAIVTYAIKGSGV